MTATDSPTNPSFELGGVSPLDALKLVVPEDPHPYVRKILLNQIYFRRCCECLEESDSKWRPTDSMLSVTGQIIHTSAAIELLLAGIFGPFDGYGPFSKFEAGFNDLSWTVVNRLPTNDGAIPDNWRDKPGEYSVFIDAADSVAKALEVFDATMNNAAKLFRTKSVQEITEKRIPPNPLFPSYFTIADVFEVLIDHTSHHRGMLVAYARKRGREPKIPYFELLESLHESM